MWTFLIFSFFILIAVVFFMPKKLSNIDLYSSYFFITLLNWSINVVIDAKYDLRGFFYKGPDYPTMLIFSIIFPCFGTIFLNYYPAYQQSIVKKSCYFVLFVFVFLMYELLLLKFKVLYFKNWNYIYSIILYAVSLLLYRYNIKFLRYLKLHKS